MLLRQTGLTSMAVQVVKILKQPLSWTPLTLPLSPGGHLDAPYNASLKINALSSIVLKARVPEPWSGSILISTAKSLQSCLTLWDPIDGSPPGSPIPGILQARTLEWVAISFSNAWKWKVKMKSVSHVRLLATPWTAAYQAPPSMGFSRQKYRSGVPLPSPYTCITC